jgi:hypothetical protein
MADEDPTLLVLHAVRLLGAADAPAVERRFGVPRAAAAELLLDGEAYGWVRRVCPDPDPAWTLTDAGRTQGERLLTSNLDARDARAAVADAHRDLLDLNGRFLAACTRWQIRPLPGDPLAANDHTDLRWDDAVLAELAALGRRLEPVGARLATALPRCDGYPRRYSAALARVERGETRWVDAPGIDSCHAVWFELHEDLIATLALRRGDPGA